MSLMEKFLPHYQFSECRQTTVQCGWASYSTLFKASSRRKIA
jgi:hypothetical protein